MRTLKDVERRILEAVEPQAEALGLEIVRIRLMGGRTPTLQFMIDKSDGGTDVEDCADFSRAASPVLDVLDPVDGAYHLEVSTPGIDRPLTRAEDFARWVGHLAKVELAMPIEGRRRFTGVLASEDNGTIVLELDDGSELEADVAGMTKASLVLTDALIEAAEQKGLAPDASEATYDEIQTDAEDAEDAPGEENKVEDNRP